MSPTVRNRAAAVAAAFALAPLAFPGAGAQEKDPWAAFKFLTGEWIGVGSGELKSYVKGLLKKKT